jgi:hypothetical protein
MKRSSSNSWRRIMRLLAGTTPATAASQSTMDADVQEFWFADFARRSDFERLMLERAGDQQAH